MFKRYLGVILLTVFITTSVYGANVGSGNTPIVQAPQAPAKKIDVEKSGMMNNSKSFVNSFKANGGYLDLGLRIGYMSGYNSFDLQHHVSELEYPFDVYLGGITASLGKNKFSLNLEFWHSLFNDPNRGWNMKDKDWDDEGDLESYTKSKSKMNALIGDVNVRYNFLDHTFKEEKAEDSNKLNLKFGGLLGYRYQRYRYRMHGLYQIVDPDWGYNEGEDVLVLGYQVTYHLPYFGLVTEIGNDKCGFFLSGKYGIGARADDIDQHILRGLTTRADYTKNPNVFMGNAGAYWKFSKDWRVNAGVDVALIRIDGRLHEENYDPDWNVDQNIDSRQFIYWIGITRRF